MHVCIVNAVHIVSVLDLIHISLLPMIRITDSVANRQAEATISPRSPSSTRRNTTANSFVQGKPTSKIIIRSADGNEVDLPSLKRASSRGPGIGEPGINLPMNTVKRAPSYIPPMSRDELDQRNVEREKEAKKKRIEHLARVAPLHSRWFVEDKMDVFLVSPGMSPSRDPKAEA